MLASLLIPLCLVLIWLIHVVRQGKAEHAGTNALPGAVLLTGLLLTFLTETLGSLGFLTRSCLILGWGLVTGVALLVLLREMLKTGFALPHHPFPQFSCLEWVLCLGNAVVLIGTLVLGLLSSPEFNADVVCYHLPRIIQWEQHADLGFFSTANLRRLLSDPFADYCLLNARLLSGTDRFGFLFQWSGYAGGAALAGGIVRLLGGSRFAQLVAFSIATTIPVAIARSIGQDNDLVATLWLLCMFWYAIRMMTGPATLLQMAAFSTAFALALLTKQYALLYALPLGLILVFVFLRAASPRGIVLLAAVGLCLTACVNGPHAARKYAFLGNTRDVLWPEKLYPSTVSSVGIRPTISTLSRFGALMLMLPNAQYARFNAAWMNTIHHWNKLDPQDPATTEQPWAFNGTPTYGAINTVGISLLAICLGIGMYRRHPVRREEWLLFGYSAVALLLLCAFSKFHIELGRYALFILFLAACGSALILDKRLGRGMQFVLGLGTICWGCFMLWFAFGMVIAPANIRSAYFDRRTCQIRNVPPAMLADYRAIAEYVQSNRLVSVGIAHRGIGNEYALWCELRRVCGSGLCVQDSRSPSSLVPTQAWQRVPHPAHVPSVLIVLAPRKRREELIAVGSSEACVNFVGKRLDLDYAEVRMPVPSKVEDNRGLR